MHEKCIVIPVGREISTLPLQLAALRTQSTQVPILLSVNAPSSLDVATAMADQYELVSVVDSSRVSGPSFARQYGAEQAQAKVILYCDADDVASPRWAEHLSAAMATADFAGGPLEYGMLNSPKLARLQHDWSTGPAKKWGHAPFFPSSNFAIRYDVLEALGGWDLSLRAAEDTDLCWRALSAGYVGAFVQEAAMSYRLRRTIRGTFQQSYGYGLGDAALFKKVCHQVDRERLISVRDGIRALASIRRVATPEGRLNSAMAIGTFMGQVAGEREVRSAND